MRLSFALIASALMAGSALAAPPDVQRGCAGKCSVAGLPDQDAIIRCNVNCQYCFDMKVKGYVRLHSTVSCAQVCGANRTCVEECHFAQAKCWPNGIDSSEGCPAKAVACSHL